MSITIAKTDPAPQMTLGHSTKSRWSSRYFTEISLTLLGFATSFAGLRVVLQGVSWWFAAMTLVAVVFVTAVLARSLMRGRIWLSHFLPPLAALLLLVPLFAAETAVFGIIPTWETVMRFAELATSGVAQIAEQSPPATPEVGIVFLVVILAMVLAWFSELWLAVGKPAVVGFAFAGILGIPVAIRAGLAEPLWFVVTAGIFLTLLAYRKNFDRLGVSVGVGAGVLVGSMVLPLAFPQVSQEENAARAGITTGLNPLVNLGDDLRRPDPVQAIRYTTDAEQPVYLRLATLDDFTGTSWTPSLDQSSRGLVEEFAMPPGLSEDVPRILAKAQVRVLGVTSRWLPLPYPTSSVAGLRGDWFWGERDLAARTEEGNARGQEYTVTFAQATPTTEQLLGVPSENVDEIFLELPEGIPEIISRTAALVAGSEDTPYAQALALQNYLRSAPFVYSEQAPVEEGFDGTGLAALAQFLERKLGYCVHYASAMAVMARELGIPARIAVGFLPGSSDLVDGEQVNIVSTSQLHAWPELYIGQAGWLRFEPTPSRGSLPSYGSPIGDDPNISDNDSETDPSQETDDLPLGDLGSNTPEDVAGSGNIPLGVGGQVPSFLWPILVGVLLLLLPAMARWAVLRFRVRAIRRGRNAPELAWAELRDTALDYGFTAPAAETPREFVARFASLLVAESGSLAALVNQVERGAYARPGAPSPKPDDLFAARKVFSRAAPRRIRVRAFLLPASLTQWLLTEENSRIPAKEDVEFSVPPPPAQ